MKNYKILYLRCISNPCRYTISACALEIHDTILPTPPLAIGLARHARGRLPSRLVLHVPYHQIGMKYQPPLDVSNQVVPGKAHVFVYTRNYETQNGDGLLACEGIQPLPQIIQLVVTTTVQSVVTYSDIKHGNLLTATQRLLQGTRYYMVASMASY